MEKLEERLNTGLSLVHVNQYGSLIGQLESEEQQFIVAEGPRQETETEKTETEERRLPYFSLTSIIQQIEDIRAFIASATHQSEQSTSLTER